MVVFAMAHWGDRWDASRRGSPPVDFIDGDTGHRIKLALVDAKTGAHVSPDRTRARAGRGADELAHWRLSQAM